MRKSSWYAQLQIPYGLWIGLSFFITSCASPSLKNPQHVARKGFFNRFESRNVSSSPNDSNAPSEVSDSDLTSDLASSSASYARPVQQERVSQDRVRRVSRSSAHADLKAVKEETLRIRKNQAQFQWPLQQVRVTSPFGKRGRSFHEGIDLKAKIGTPVLAVQAGKVLYAGSGIKGYGKMIVIRHSGLGLKQLSTIYAHNSRLLVRAGQKVNQGEEIALSGNSGRSLGPHLHFEMREGIATLDPLKFLPHLTPPLARRASSDSVYSRRKRGSRS